MKPYNPITTEQLNTETSAQNNLQIRHESSPREVASMNTAELRAHFLVEKLFQTEEIKLTYSHYDRMMIGGAMPGTEAITLPNLDELKADFFLQRREIGIINVGGDGHITVNGTAYDLQKMDCLYVGKGAKNVEFSSANASQPAQYFLLSAPAHHAYPTQLMKKEAASPQKLGAIETANKRTIYKYIHRDGIPSCQLVMGLTVLDTGSVWNTMPAHTHDRRMEVYCYFDVPENQAVLHLMGQPQETRHIWISNHQAVISPPWSIHAGSGTTNYAFIWGMAGENQDFTDMDFLTIDMLR